MDEHADFEARRFRNPVAGVGGARGTVFGGVGRAKTAVEVEVLEAC